MTTYIQAAPRPPTIICPAWCVVPHEHHLAELSQWRGKVIHHSGPLAGGVEVGSCNYPDGTPDPNEGTRVYPSPGGDDLSVEEAEQLAQNILRVLAAVRGVDS